MSHKLLVLDDDKHVVSYLADNLSAKGYAVTGLTSPREALARLESEAFDLVITDVEMPELRGTELLAQILARRPGQLVLLITAFGSVEMAVEAVKAGACDFIAKPFKLEALLFAIERAFRDRELRREIVRLRSTQPLEGAGQLVAKSPAMRQVVDQARRASRTQSTVLLTGETGTGKSAVARFIHQGGARKAEPFVELNCAALPPGLIESELFGVKRGAFTDAKEDRPGAFASAGSGTVFLDEVGELPLEAQAKLLHALEVGKVRPLGSSSTITLTARVIAATNRPLEVLLREGRFRPDLYFRLNVIRIEVPPLRDRREDIVPLIDLLLSRLSERDGQPLLGISASAVRRLLAYPWPGNVRELANLLERAAAMTDLDTIVPENLDLPRAGSAVEDLLGQSSSGKLPLAEVERAYVRRVVADHEGNKAAAARVLGINRRTLDRKLGQ
ncbi:MAG: sigma-54-dependent Fis family transcriptional regulator [Archangiaceae bacterium]|nr:sigma-54-dependent Fis family transcriptional regulator [Archangiaceae bacterium]